MSKVVINWGDIAFEAARTGTTAESILDRLGLSQHQSFLQAGNNYMLDTRQSEFFLQVIKAEEKRK